MKVIIAGSRSITSASLVEQAIQESTFEITEVVSGNAHGVDSLGESWAVKNNVPIKRFIPDWKTFGREAGLLRNTEMVSYAEALVAVWNGISKGTADTIRKATDAGLKVYVKKVEEHEQPKV